MDHLGLVGFIFGMVGFTMAISLLAWPSPLKMVHSV